MTETAEIWQHVPLAPPDSIFKLTAAYKADTFPQKVNLGVGAYRDDDNKPWVLPVVRKAEALVFQDLSLDHEYLPILGLPSYTEAAARLILGANSPAIAQGRVISAQTISGTGANHLGAIFLSRFYDWNGGEKKIYLSNPTWANHHAIFKNVGITPVDYAYYDPKTIGLDYEGMIGDMERAPRGSVFLLHACAHNPTGVDPTREQWEGIADTMLKNGLYAFFDCAYQGFASGDLEADAWAVDRFVERGVPMLVCQSFAKNAGLYGERIGALHVVTENADASKRVGSQLSVLQRSEISNPPTFGARVISGILNDPTLFGEWKEDIKVMAGRIIEMRKQLHHILTNELKTPGNWDHIINQIGMFSFTGITVEQSAALVEKAHIYLTANGRISMAGLNSHNIHYFATSLDRAKIQLDVTASKQQARSTPVFLKFDYMSSFSSKKPSFISLPPAPVFGSLSLSSSPSQRENPCDDSTPNSSGAPPSPCLLFYTAPSSPLTEQSPSPPITEQLSASFPQEEDQFPTADLSGALDVPLDDEALSALEKIYLFSRSDAAYHRVYISHALPEFLDHIEPAEATEYVLPLLRGLAMDSEDQVKEALAAELVPIIWWYFSVEDPRLELDPNAEAGPTPVSVQAFTPILGTLLLSPSGQIGGAARFAVVELLRRMRQADEHVAVASGLFGPNERELFRAELFEQVVIGMGRLDVDTGGDEDDQETQGQEQTPKEGQGELQSRRTPLTEPDNPYFPPLVRSHSEPPYFGRTSEFRPPPASPGTFPLPSPPLPTRQNANRPLSPPVEVPGRGEAINLDSDASEQAAVGRLSCMSLMAAVTASDALTEETKLAFVSELERIGRDPIYWVRREASFALGALAKVVPQEIVLSSLLPLFENLRQDSTWHVRHSALFALPAILSRLTASHRRTLALSIVPALSIDPAPSVRAGLLEALGEIIHTFFEDLTGPPETILRLFLGRREDKRVRDGRQSPRALAADVIHAMLHGTNKTPPPYDADAALDSFYTDPSRPLICAFNFPAVAQAMGPSRWGEIRHAYKDLTENRAVKVRRTLAASLGALAGVLGAEFTRRDLTKVWWDAIRAPEEEIRGKAIECMVAFVRALLSDGQGSAVGGELVGGLLTVWEEGVLRGWRERESAASALVGLAELVGEQYPRAIRGLLRRALEDGVAAVRETAVAAAPKIWRAYTHRPDVRAGLKEDVRALAVSSTARRRMGYAAVQLALLLPGKDGTSTCVPDADCWARLSTLAEDSVIDVRIGVARLAGAARTVLYKDGTGVPATLTNILQKLQRDPVGEVRAFVQGDEVNLDGGTFSRPPPVLRLQKRKKQYSNWQHKFSVHELEQALEGLAKGELQGH